MPKPQSPAQFRFLQAVAHGTHIPGVKLTPGQAQAGLSEASHAERSKLAKGITPHKKKRKKTSRERAFGG